MKIIFQKLSIIMIMCLFFGSCGVSTEARKFVRDYLKNKVVRCGDFSYTQHYQGNLVQMKNFDFAVESKELNEAGRMNGYEFGGYVHFTASAFRVIRSEDKRCWGTWQSDNLWPYFPSTLEIYKQKGKWRLESSWSGDPKSNSMPECSSVQTIVECFK